VPNKCEPLGAARISEGCTTSGDWVNEVENRAIKTQKTTMPTPTMKVGLRSNALAT